MPAKFILIILDGLGDRSFQRLGHMTPLQAARTPFLDRFAASGSSGLFHASLQGQALPSENAHFVLLGYEPGDFPGRGALEALGAGIDLDQSQVAVLAHFVNVQKELGRLRLIMDRVRAGSEDAGQAFNAVHRYDSENVRIELVQVKGLFGVVILTGNVSPFITDSNPILDGRLLTRIRPRAEYSDHGPSIDAANSLNKYLSWVHRKLEATRFNRERSEKGFPALNALVTQRAGRLKQVISFTRKFGLKGASVSSGAVYSGLCRYLGLDVLEAPESVDPGLEISTRIEKAADLIDKYDFVHIHSKAPDEAAHKKDPFLKKQVIQELDLGLARSLPGLLQREDLIVAVTSDHSTPSKGEMIHCGEPVPLAICGPGVRVDGVLKFDEMSAAGGGLGFVRGAEFMYMVLNYLDRGKLAGLMDTPHDQPYWPGDPVPFELE